MKRWRNAAVAVWVSVGAYAADGVWTNTVGGVWSNLSNWASSTPATGAGFGANFMSLSLSQNMRVHDPEARTLGALSFGDTEGGFAWVLGDADAFGNRTGEPLTLSRPLSRPEITVSNTTVYLSKRLDGSEGFVKLGTGALYLLTNTVYSGLTEVREGTLSFGSPHPDTVFEIIAYYPFDDPQNIGRDASGKGNDLSAEGGVSYSAAGRFEGGVHFDGSSNLKRATVQGFPSGDESFTMAAWVKTASTNKQSVMGWGNTAANRSYTALQLQPEDGNILHYVIDSSYIFTTIAGDQTSGWMHVAMVYDSAAKLRTFYINGNPGSTKATPVLSIPAQNFMVGLAYTTQRYFEGTMDEVVVAKGAMSEAQVRLLMMSIAPAKAATSPAADITVGSYGTLAVQDAVSLKTLAGKGIVQGSEANLEITGTSVFGGRIEGSLGFRVATGDGTVTLSGANGYTGGTHVVSGTLEVKDASDLEAHLIAHYSFDDASDLGADGSGHGNGLAIRYTNRPAPFHVPDGKVGGAVGITNDNWLVRSATNFIGLSTGNVPFTVSAWFNFADDAPDGSTLFAWRLASGDSVCFRLYNGSRSVAATGNGNLDVGSDFVAGDPPDGWHHIALMYVTNGVSNYGKSQVLLGFLDGVKALELSVGPRSVADAVDFLVGTYFSAPDGSFYRGLIDEFVVLDRADPDDVSRLMNGVRQPVHTHVLPGIVAHYPFDDPERLERDRSVFTNHLSEADPAVGPLSWAAGGIFGGALSITNKNWLKADSFPSGMARGDAPFTVALWVKPASDCPKTAMLFYWGGSLINNSFRAQLNNSYTVLGVGPWQASTLVSIPDLRNAWHHMAVTYDPAGGACRQTVYLDGKIVSQAFAKSVTPGGAAFRIGNGAEGTTRVYKGLIDECVLFNRALAPWEVGVLMTNSASVDYNVLPVDGTVTLEEGAELAIQQTSQRIAALNGAGTVTLERGRLCVLGGSGGTFNGVLTGDGLFEVTEGACQTVGGTDAMFAGCIHVTNATLEMIGAMSPDTLLTVQGGGRFGGSGTLAGATVVKAGGKLESRFNEADLMFAGGLAMESGSGLLFTAEAGASGNVVVAGTLTLPEVCFVEASLPAGVTGQYVLIRADALAGNTALNNWQVSVQPELSGGWCVNLRIVGNSIILSVSPQGTLFFVR